LPYIDLVHQVVPGGVVWELFDKTVGFRFDVGWWHGADLPEGKSRVL
jgi:hypothetical protein